MFGAGPRAPVDKPQLLRLRLQLKAQVMSPKRISLNTHANGWKSGYGSLNRPSFVTNVTFSWRDRTAGSGGPHCEVAGMASLYHAYS